MTPMIVRPPLLRGVSSPTVLVSAAPVILHKYAPQPAQRPLSVCTHASSASNSDAHNCVAGIDLGTTNSAIAVGALPPAARFFCF